MNKKQPEALRLADDLEASSHFPGNMRSCNNAAASELRRLHAENETLRAGYAAARLEIESLKAQHTGAAYAELPECSAFLLCKGSDVTARAWNVDQMRAFADATCELRASHRQAPVQAAPAAVAGLSEFPHEKMDAVALGRYKVVSSDQSMFYRFAVVAGDGTQQLYIGREVDCQNMARKFAGAFLDGAFAYHSMTVAPTTQQAPQQEAPADELEEVLRERDDAEDFINELLDEVLGADRPEWSSAYNRYDAMNDVRERITALHKPAVDKAWGRFESAMAEHQPSTAAQGDALDAARYRWLREGNDAKHSAAWHVAVNLYGCEWDAAIDAARKQGENHD